MRKVFLLTIASLMTVFAMAIGNNDGSAKGNAIEFDWDKGIEHPGGSQVLWYRVDLAPLYEEEDPSLTLYLTNPSNEVGTSVDVSMQATVAGQTESKEYSIAARQYKTYSANASVLVRMKQTEIYLTLKSSGPIKLSAKVFEAADLDETCKDAETLKWYTTTTQNPMYSKWWRISLANIKDTTKMKKDAKVTITNIGTKTVTLKAGQSLDCPSSGLTKRSYELAPGESVIDTIPQSMIMSVQPDELYFGLENIESKISIRVDTVAQPKEPVIAETAPFVDLHVTDTIKSLAPMTYYRIKVSEMNSLAKYEPEFTYRNASMTGAPAKVTIKMAFEVPAFGTSNTTYELEAGHEEIVVYKKNMLEGMDGDVEYIYLLTLVEGDVDFYGRFKHVREGKACKTNIDFNWESGHTQEARTTQWYAIVVTEAINNMQDIIVHVANQGSAPARLKASMAFSCPYIDVQEVSQSIAVGATLTKRMGYSSYSMMKDTVWIGLETNQNLRFWAETVNAQTKPEPDTLCLHAVDFSWEEGVMQHAGDTVWYRIDMEEVREHSAKFPMILVQNMSSTNAAKITAEMSVECPDSIENQSRSLTIEANGSYSKKLSADLFKNIVADELYVRIVSTQDVALQVVLTEKPAGSDCESAIAFNWTSGNKQDANANLWYAIDLRDVMKSSDDVRVKIENKENVACKGVAQLIYSCPMESSPSIQNFNLAAKGSRSITLQNSSFETLEDSVVYVNLQGTTSLHIEATRIPQTEPFDTIYAEGLTLIPLQWDSLYTQSVDTAWYIISKEEIDKVRNMEEKVKPVAHLFNLSSKSITIKSEGAFAFPIVKQMMTKNMTLKGGQHYSDTIPAGTFDQLMKKDSVIIRMTRPKGSGDFQFRAELIGAFGGNSRYDASPIIMNKEYAQSPNTEMWYKLNTADLKKDKNLYNKVLNVVSKNAGKGETQVEFAIYEGLLSETDLVEYYTGKTGKRTLKKGEQKSHNVPAQAIYAVGDLDMYIKIRTTDSLYFSTKFASEYAPIASADIDTMQFHAKLIVPNVDYILPADTDMWFMVCVPYLRNNYKYVNASTLEYELEGNGPAKLKITGTFQDTMTYKMPVRERTINKSGKARSGKRYLRELLDEAVKRKLPDYGVPELPDNDMDSLMRHFITADSVTGYIRVRSDKAVRLRLNMPKVTGDRCLNPMDFDWEHGNVNQAKDTSWMHVSMELEDPRIPMGKDLMLHMDNWTEGATNVKAIIYEEDCSGKELGKVNKLILSDTTKIIERDLLVKWGWSGFMIKYYSDSTTHIWAEIIDHVDHDTIFDTIPAQYVCPNTNYIDSINTPHLIDPEDPASWTFDNVIDSVIKAEAKIVTYVYTFNVYPKAAPVLPKIDSLTNIPAVSKGDVLDCSAASAELLALLKDSVLSDSISRVLSVDDITWEYCVDGINWLEIPETALDTAAIGLRYSVLTECDSTYISDEWINIPVYDIFVDTCGSYTWPRTGETYTKDTIVLSPEIPINALTSKKERLNLTLSMPAASDTIATVCPKMLPFVWHGISCEAAGDYNDTLKTVAGCDSIVTLHLIFSDVLIGDTIEVTVCPAQLPYNWNGIICEAAGFYNDTVPVVAGCDSVVTLHLIVSDVLTSDTSATVCPGLLPFVWHGISCEAEGDYNDTVKNLAGCDSIITLHLSVSGVLIGDTIEVTVCPAQLPYIWNGKISCSEAGFYNDTVPVVADCDYVVTLHLIVSDILAGDTTAVVCPGQLPYLWHGIYRAEEGDYVDTLQNDVLCDSVVTLHLIVSEILTGEENITVCPAMLPYLWHGISCAEAGDYKDTVKNAVLCDSVVTLHLSVSDTLVGDTTAAVCPALLPFEWHGISCAEAGDYNDTVKNFAGCDSIVTLHLVVTEIPTGDEYETVCPALLPFVWHGISCEAAGNYDDTLQTVAGCDSIVTLHLTVSDIPTGDEYDTICPALLPLVWHGISCDAAGDYYDTLKISGGCDSIVTFHLFVTERPTSDTTVTICPAMLPFEWRGISCAEAGEYHDTLPISGGCDSIVILYLNVSDTLTSDTFAIACESFPWHGTTYTVSGDYQLALKNEAGCDSIVTLHLTVGYPGTSEEYDTICPGQLPFDWNGTSCAAAGDYTVTLTSFAGCDSVVTLHLAVSDEVLTGDTLAEACESFEWYGATYSASGDYTHMLQSAAGCDSLLTLHLTIKHATTGEESITVCPAKLPYDWHGISCAAAGDYKDTLVNAVGCDSIVTLHLIVSDVLTGDTAATACESFEWYGATYTASGNYTHPLQNAVGCDSIVTLHLTINHATFGEESETACGAYEWRGKTYTVSGDYKDTLSNAAGCDSIVTLHLTILSEVFGSETATGCNFYKWETDGNTYYNDTTVSYTIVGGSVNGCDSTVTLTLDLSYPTVLELEAVSKYGNRLLMINRLDINEKTGWNLDSVGAHVEVPEVQWYRKGIPTDQLVGVGYYLINKEHPGEPLVGTYYATIDVPTSGACGQFGRTKDLICAEPKNAAPALMPSLARPGEDVHVVNLDPDQETTIRVYTTEGLIQGTYTVSGEESFVIKAAVEHGFYLVELRNDSLQTTLRYIVK
jgi:hypothetical protein